MESKGNFAFLRLSHLKMEGILFPFFSKKKEEKTIKMVINEFKLIHPSFTIGTFFGGRIKPS